MQRFFKIIGLKIEISRWPHVDGIALMRTISLLGFNIELPPSVLLRITCFVSLPE